MSTVNYNIIGTVVYFKIGTDKYSLKS